MLKMRRNLLFPFMATLLGIASVGNSAFAQAAPQAEAKEESGSLFEGVDLNDERFTAGEEFVVPGEFSIATPTGGFKWKEIRNEDTEKSSDKWYSCTKEGQKAGIVLGVEMRSAESDPAKLETLRGTFNTMLYRMDQRGFTNPKAKQPSMTTPVADRVEYEIAAKTPSGTDTYILGETIFGGRVFSIQVTADSRQQAEDLRSIVKKSFKDLSPPVDATLRGEAKDGEFVVPGHFSVAMPGIGYKWGLAQVTDANGVQVPTYACTKEDGPSTVVLTVQKRPEQGDVDSLANKHFEVLKGQFKASGYTDIQERAPKASDSGDRVTFALRGKDPKGKTTYLFGVTVLGRNLYTIHLISPSEDEARQLHKAISTFKELPPA